MRPDAGRLWGRCWELHPSVVPPSLALIVPPMQPRGRPTCTDNKDSAVCVRPRAQTAPLRACCYHRPWMAARDSRMVRGVRPSAASVVVGMCRACKPPPRPSISGSRTSCAGRDAGNSEERAQPQGRAPQTSSPCTTYGDRQAQPRRRHTMTANESTAQDQVGLQFSVYPLRQAHLHAAIEAAVQAAAKAGVNVTVGRLSTFAPGDEESVFAAHLPTSREPSWRGSVRSFAPSGACAHTRLQEFRLWEGPNPGERANSYGPCRASRARAAHEIACESGACGTPGSSPAAAW